MIQRNRFLTLPGARFIQGPLGPRPILAGLLIVLTVWACGGEESIGPPPPVASVEVTPASVTLVSLGETVQLAASAQDASGNTIADKSFTWSSSDDSIATVSDAGLVTALANGLVTITATTDAVEGAAAIGVAQAAAQLAFTVQPTETIVGLGIWDFWPHPVTGRWVRTPTTVAIQDALGNLVTVATDAVTLAFGANPSGGMLEGTTTRTVFEGVAAFGLSVDRAGVGYTLVASAPGLANATSAAFDVIALNFASVSTGGAHTCGLTTTGTAYCWGDNYYGRLGVKGCPFGTVCELVDSLVTGASTSTPVAVSGGLTFAYLTDSCGLTSTGSAYCWGGQSHLWEPKEVPGGFTFTSFSGSNSPGAIYFHGCGITATGTAYCRGSNRYGQVGDGTTTSRTTPVAVSGGPSFASVSARFFHTCGITTTGDAYCWGFNGYGQLGTDLSLGTCGSAAPVVCGRTPVPVSGGLKFVSLSPGNSHTCGITTDGTVYCWGSNLRGELGTDAQLDSCEPYSFGDPEPCSRVPVAVAGGLTFASVSAGLQRTCGLTTTGTAYCWGTNEYAQVGDGTRTDRTTPVAVVGGFTFASVSSGAWHTCGLTTSGTAYCWGRNVWGQLGNGTRTNSSIPVRVIGQP